MQHPHRVKLCSVEDENSRPLWSVMIPTYNCADYLRETLSSVLAQNIGPDIMQIEVIDDYSTLDDPEKVVEELGRGRVGFHRQANNVGYIRNFETCLQRSRGKLIHILHGDDCVRDGFYRKLQRAFDEGTEIGAAFCRTILMDEHSHWQSISPLEQDASGILGNWLERIATQGRIFTPSIVVRRDVYEKLGGFDRRMICWAEDWEMWVRIAAKYPMWFEVEPLALYRLHSNSLTARSVRTAQNIRDLRRAIDIFRPYLPDDIADVVTSKARENYALFALNTADRMVGNRDVVAALAQIREGLKCSHSMRIVWQVIHFCALWGWRLARLALSRPDRQSMA